MAWNPSPKVADCRVIALKWGMKQVIVIALDPEFGQIAMATYGETKALCAKTKELGDAAYAAVMAKYADAELDAGDGSCPCGSGTVLGTCPRCGLEIGRVL